MAQKFDYPKSEQELRTLLDELYRTSLEAKERTERASFKGLIEIMKSEVVILTAIHNIKSNRGSRTPGSDGETMRNNILEKQYTQVIQRVQTQFEKYTPQPVRRVWIDKPGKSEKRPLGIPAIIDRVVQECMRIVLEPILEAQFFAHSYGFRPMRDAQMAMERVNFITHQTGYHWIIEGDISKFFDNVNHTILLRKLWSMGVHDRRVLMIIKQMLKAGIMDEMETNPLGTPQGGIISPLLTNAYLNTFDQWIVREWEQKRTKHSYSPERNRFRALKTTKLKPAYLIRYADDWVLITNTKSNAEKWKRRIATYLETNLKLHLNDEKTLITNVHKRRIHFVGYDMKLVRSSNNSMYTTRTYPNEERVKRKVAVIRNDLRQIRRMKDIEYVIHAINRANSQIRGMIEYFQYASWVNKVFSKYAQPLAYTAYKALKTFGGTWTPAKELNNLTGIHAQYETSVPSVQWQGLNVGVTNLRFVSWRKKTMKNQLETPYTLEGRQLYGVRTGRTPLLARADEMLSLTLSHLIATGQKAPIYNFEYLLNRGYALNRDKGRCRICSLEVRATNVHIHHIQTQLPLNEINRVTNLATTHDWCHRCIHDGKDHSELGAKAWNKILDFRKKLKLTN